MILGALCMLSKLLPHVAHAYALRGDKLPKTNRIKYTFFATRCETSMFKRCRQNVLQILVMTAFPLHSSTHNASDIRR